MKRILAMSLIVMTILLSFTGCEWFASEQAEAGTLEVIWDPDAASKITLDGDMSDWVQAGQDMDGSDILYFTDDSGFWYYALPPEDDSDGCSSVIGAGAAALVLSAMAAAVALKKKH